MTSFLPSTADRPVGPKNSCQGLNLSQRRFRRFPFRLLEGANDCGRPSCLHKVFFSIASPYGWRLRHQSYRSPLDPLSLNVFCGSICDVRPAIHPYRNITAAQKVIATNDRLPAARPSRSLVRLFSRKHRRIGTLYSDKRASLRQDVTTKRRSELEIRESETATMASIGRLRAANPSFSDDCINNINCIIMEVYQCRHRVNDQVSITSPHRNTAY